MTEKSVVVEGFTVLPVKFSEKYDNCHYLYCKVHRARHAQQQHTPVDRTLFVVGVPPYCTEEALTRLFSQCGKVARVILTNKPSAQPVKEQVSKFFPNGRVVSSFKVAYVVFKHSKALRAAESLALNEPFLLSTPDCEIKTGLEKWRQEYVDGQNVNTKELQEDVDTFMADYDRRVEKEAELEKRNDGKPDEDGWITVTKSGKYKGVPRTEAEEERTKAKEKKKRKDKELLNFYTFQIRESKRERIADLRRKFEEDKQKIAQLKSSRRFRPF